jgi:Rps23 Pro-64 3,4-dihydroxylase Tpa1-like proline 4-hydroxylase
MNSLEFIPGRARSVQKVISPEMCQEMIRKFEKDYTFRPCKYNSDIDTDYRDSSEVKIKDRKIIDKLWQHIKKYVPTVCDGQTLVGPHYSRVYILRYFEGQYFRKHYDGYSESSKGHRSRLTLLVYLNDMSQECGGATRFYAEPERSILFIDPYQHYPVYDFIPTTGSMVLFTHRLLHEGMPILRGYKYCIRLNILYTNTVPEAFISSSQIRKRKFTTVPECTNNKSRKTDERQTAKDCYKDIPEFKHPAPNDLKYKTATMDNGKVTLTPNREDQNSIDRWNDVSLRPHVFKIRKAEFPGFIDTTMGRPPTWKEDYCPNCYEILPLQNNYTNCSGCNCPVVSIDAERRDYNMSLSD